MGGDFGDVLLELNEVLLQLVVAQQRVLVIGRVVHDAAPELRGGGTNAENQNQEQLLEFSFSSDSFLFCPQRFEGILWLL